MANKNWADLLQIKYFPDGYGKLPEKSFATADLDQLTPDNFRKMTDEGHTLSWHDDLGIPLIYHLIDSKHHQPVSPKTLDYLLNMGINPDTVVYLPSQSAKSLLEIVSEDLNPKRRSEYMTVLMNNRVDVCRNDCGRKALWNLMVDWSGCAVSEVKLLLDSGCIDVEKKDDLNRSVLDWADNGYVCKPEVRKEIYAFYRLSRPEVAENREKETQEKFICEYEGAQAQRNLIRRQMGRELLQWQQKTEELTQKIDEISASQAEKKEDQKAEYLRQGVEILHCFGGLLSAAGNKIQKIDSQNINQIPVQAIKDFFKLFSR